MIYYNNDFWQKDTPSFSTADHVTNNVTINNIYPNKNFTHTFLSSSPANTLKDWDKGCLPHRKICQPHASCRKTTRSKQQIENRPLFRKYQMLSKCFSFRCPVLNFNQHYSKKQHEKQKTELQSYLQKPKKKANLGMNVHFLTAESYRAVNWCFVFWKETLHS